MTTKKFTPAGIAIIFVVAIAGFFLTFFLRQYLQLQGMGWGALFGAIGAGGGAVIGQIIAAATGQRQ